MGRFVVIGATGFIGSPITEAIYKQGHACLAVARVSNEKTK